MKVPTVKIKAKTRLGYMIINKGDFEDGVHQLFDETAKEAIESPPQPDPGSAGREFISGAQQSESKEAEPEGESPPKRGRPPKTDKE